MTRFYKKKANQQSMKALNHRHQYWHRIGIKWRVTCQSLIKHHPVLALAAAGFLIHINRRLEFADFRLHLAGLGASPGWLAVLKTKIYFRLDPKEPNPKRHFSPLTGFSIDQVILVNRPLLTLWEKMEASSDPFRLVIKKQAHRKAFELGVIYETPPDGPYYFISSSGSRSLAVAGDGGQRIGGT